MTRTEAARQAHHIVAKLIENYFDTHDPDNEETNEKDSAKMAAALNHIMAVHYRKAGYRFDAAANLARTAVRNYR